MAGVSHDTVLTENDQTENKTSMEKELSLDELVEELKQHPAFMTEFDETKPLSPAMEGLQALKYQSDNIDENAISYKEDGNKNFEKGKYRWAIDNYTAGIKCRPADRLLNAVLYTNRAAAQYRIGNYRSSYNDCILARKFKADHHKAIVRGAMCCLQLKMYSDAIQWANEALKISPSDSKMTELVTKADKLVREDERDKRRQLAVERKQAAEEQKLINAIVERGLRLAEGKGNDQLSLSDLESQHPSGAKVKLDAENVLHWPVLFLYPEYGEYDLIESFDERSIFSHHLAVMFDNNRPVWDVECKYTTDKLKLYFEDRDKEQLYQVKKDSSLLSTLKNKRYVIRGGTPTFIVLVEHSNFQKQFLAKYNASFNDS